MTTPLSFSSIYYADDYVTRRAIGPEVTVTTPLSFSTRCRSSYLIPIFLQEGNQLCPLVLGDVTKLVLE